MLRIHHLNCGWLHAPPNPRAACHCLLLEHADHLTLVDTGIGLADVHNPTERIGAALIAAAGFQFDEANTALRQLQARGFTADRVRRIILTHADPDHAGGLADFPHADVHVSAEELDALLASRPAPPAPRYLPIQFTHGVRWHPLGPGPRTWRGLPARPVWADPATNAQILLIPLFGHTAGHCGVAIRPGGDHPWLLHVGDAYYLRAELTDHNHPVDALAATNAVDDLQRRLSLDAVRRLVRTHADEVRVIGYHDESELPAT